MLYDFKVCIRYNITIIIMCIHNNVCHNYNSITYKGDLLLDTIR